MLFSGSSHQALIQEICTDFKFKKGNLSIRRFKDNEMQIEILDDVKCERVFILQSFAHRPNELIIETLLIIHAMKKASAKTIDLIIPYFAYARQNKGGIPSAQFVFDLLKFAGVTHITTLDIHDYGLSIAKNNDFENINCHSLFEYHLKSLKIDSYFILGPDRGSYSIAKNMSILLKAPFCVAEKIRSRDGNISMQLSESVENENVIIVDDILATGKTLITAAQLCQNDRAAKVIAIITHALFLERDFFKSHLHLFDALLMTNSVEHKEILSDKIQVFSIASLIAQILKKKIKDYDENRIMRYSFNLQIVER